MALTDWWNSAKNAVVSGYDAAASSVTSLWQSDPIQTPPTNQHESLFSGPNWSEINRVLADHPESAARVNEAFLKPAPEVPGVLERITGTVSGAFSGYAAGVQKALMPIGIGLVALAAVLVFIYIAASRR